MEIMMSGKSIYTTGEFAKRANVSVRTIRYYDDKGLLKPSEIRESGYRYYTDPDFIKLQQIIVLRKLGFSLEDILVISSREKDTGYVRESFDLQLSLVRDKIAELKQMEQTISEARDYLDGREQPDWSRLIGMIHLLNMKETLAKQYKNSKNVDARIHLHKAYSANPQGWFCWIYEKLPMHDNIRILEAGCGNGQLWKDNSDRLPGQARITLSDISSGMLRNARENLSDRKEAFQFECFDFQDIPCEASSFDLVIANHALFYAKDRDKALRELSRVLKKEGCFCCSTYGRLHMREIELLAKEFDERIALSEVKLYDIFSLDHGEEELAAYFSSVEKYHYEDSLLVTELAPLAEYIYSCHGNQMQYLSGRQEAFERFLERKIGRKGLRITKDAGIFLCRL
jgi:DNA-binding transcriptional MerR regulator/ubiquinone/menaquinone biosynthesis C-methylase UbiE